MNFQAIAKWTICEHQYGLELDSFSADSCTGALQFCVVFSSGRWREIRTMIDGLLIQVAGWFIKAYEVYSLAFQSNFGVQKRDNLADQVLLLLFDVHFSACLLKNKKRRRKSIVTSLSKQDLYCNQKFGGIYILSFLVLIWCKTVYKQQAFCLTTRIIPLHPCQSSIEHRPWLVNIMFGKTLWFWCSCYLYCLCGIWTLL